MTRQLIARNSDAAGPILTSLEQDEEVWESAYAEVMSRPDLARLHAFWLHYYGASAEMRFAGTELNELCADLRAMLSARAVLTPAARAFLEAFERLAHEAYTQGAVIDVIAD